MAEPDARRSLDARYRLREDQDEVERQALDFAHYVQLRREFLLYFAFLVLFCFVTFWPRNDVPFMMEEAIRAQVITPPVPTLPDGGGFWNITQREQWFDWVEFVAVPGLLGRQWYNGGDLEDDDDGFSAVEKPITPWVAYSNMLVGDIRLRQLRVRDDACRPARWMADAVPFCSAPYSADVEAKGDWKGTPWRSEWDLREYIDWKGPFSTTKYPGSGHVVDLPVRYISEAYAEVQRLRRNEWVDRFTRALFVDFTVYNANEDMFATTRAALEFLPTGYVNPSVTVIKAPLIRVTRTLENDSVSAKHWLLLVMETLMFCIVGYFITRLVDDLVHQGARRFFSSWFNIVDSFNLTCFAVVFIMRVAAVMFASALPRKLQEATTTTEEDGKVLQNHLHFFVARQNESVAAVTAAVCFFRFFKFMTFWGKLQQLVATMLRAIELFSSLLACVAIIFVGYAMAFTMAFAHERREFMDLSESIFALFSASLGSFDLLALRTTNRYLGPLLFVSFIFVTYFVVLAMILRLAVGAYREVASTLKAEEEERGGQPWGIHKLGIDTWAWLGYVARRLGSKLRVRAHRAHTGEHDAPPPAPEVEYRGAHVLIHAQTHDGRESMKEFYKRRRGVGRPANQVRREAEPVTSVMHTMGHMSEMHTALDTAQILAEEMLDTLRANKKKRLLEARGKNLKEAMGPREAQSYSLFDEHDYADIGFAPKKRQQKWSNPYSAPPFRATPAVRMPEEESMVPEDDPYLYDEHFERIPEETKDVIDDVPVPRDTAVRDEDIARANDIARAIPVPRAAHLTQADYDRVRQLMETPEFQKM